MSKEEAKSGKVMTTNNAAVLAKGTMIFHPGGGSSSLSLHGLCLLSFCIFNNKSPLLLAVPSSSSTSLSSEEPYRPGYSLPYFSFLCGFPAAFSNETPPKCSLSKCSSLHSLLFIWRLTAFPLKFVSWLTDGHDAEEAPRNCLATPEQPNEFPCSLVFSDFCLLLDYFYGSSRSGGCALVMAKLLRRGWELDEDLDI